MPLWNLSHVCAFKKLRVKIPLLVFMSEIKIDITPKNQISSMYSYIWRKFCIYLAIRWGFPLSRVTTNNWISPMKFCLNTSFTLPKQFQRIRSRLFWKEITPSYNLRNMVKFWVKITLLCSSNGTPIIICFPFFPNRKLMLFRCPNI